MILLGQYDSPFVRRVAIALRLYGMDYSHKPWSTFGDADRIAEYNPLLRVPVLVLPEGESLIDSMVILDHLDELAGPERALLPASGSDRRQQLRLSALAAGLADKAVAMLYECLLHKQVSRIWLKRCEGQIRQTLDLLEETRQQATGDFDFGQQPGHSDIMLACALRFVSEAHTDQLDISGWRALCAHATRCEALPVFQEIRQPFIPPR